MRNSGSSTWLGRDAGVGAVNLGVQLLDADGHMKNLDYQRVPLRRESEGIIEPGEAVEFEFEVTAPDISPYRLSFDLVSEGVGWFRDLGLTPVVQTELLG